MPAEQSATRTDWSAVEALFAHAVDLPPDDRVPLLENCVDARVRAAVVRLLERHERLERRTSANPLATLDSRRAAALVIYEDLAPGTMLGPYRIVSTLGEGSMGTVYRAADPLRDREVALKVLAPYLDSDPLVVRRFRDEARIASSVDHPHVAGIHDVGETEDGALFIAMPLCPGGTLRDRLTAGTLPLAEVIQIGTQLASALAAAHALDIVHRDVKPENILFTDDDTACITDFGIARISGRQITRTGMTLGTAAYMSPEQTRGEPVDHRADIWSLGVVLFEMTTGRRPFGVDGRADLLASIRHQVPLSVGDLSPDAPTWLVALIARCLEKDPSRRPADAREVGAILERQGSSVALDAPSPHPDGTR